MTQLRQALSRLLRRKVTIEPPGIEDLGSDEMRVSFIGSAPVPPTLSQAGTAIMVELGNGKRFFFDLGPGCLRNIVALQVPLRMVNDVFITHLHVDHYAELPYIFAFAPWMGRWKPLRVHGPSGRTPQDGIKYMIAGMKMMTRWHTDSFNCLPMGDGYEVEVNEFDFQDDNGVCYDKDGVVIRHWRRAHGKNGASAYRLDWNGLSFVWTGDGRPDADTAKFSDRRALLRVVSKRVDVSLESEWGDRPAHTRIVAIGARGAIVGHTLQKQFDQCLAKHQEQKAWSWL